MRRVIRNAAIFFASVSIIGAAFLYGVRVINGYMMLGVLVIGFLPYFMANL